MLEVFFDEKKFKKFHHHGHLWWPLEVTSDAGWSKLKNGPEVSLKGSSVQNFNNFHRTVFSQSIFKETLFWTLKGPCTGPLTWNFRFANDIILIIHPTNYPHPWHQPPPLHFLKLEKTGRLSHIFY